MSNKQKNRLVATRYAKALMDLAGDSAPALAEEAKALQKVCEQSDVLAFLHNPLLNRAQSAEVATTLLYKIGAPALLKDTIVRMAHNRRLSALPDMLEQFVRLVEQRENIIRVKIVSAKPLSEQDVSKLSDKIAATYQCKLRIETQVDESLIGGVSLHMGDKHIDYSVAGKLERLKTQLKHTPLAK